MELRKLYYEDCHLNRFTARVLSCEKTEQGWLVTLDQTAFYPEGGGQASDVGTLGGVAVLHAAEAGEQVVHLCGGPLEVGSTVEGQIDYAHRFDLMQQHTGEHMVSGILHRRYGAHNTGFHMGADTITIDFDVDIPAGELPLIEAEANRAVWQNLPVKCWYPSREELPGVTYRAKRALPWPVRIVQVGDVDSCACCGVHVARTGEVGLIKLFSCVRFRGGSRIEMLCGRRALDYLNQVLVQNQMVSRAFSAKALETGAAAEKMNEALAQLKYRVTGLENRIFDTIAQSHAGRGNTLLLQPGLEPQSARRLADLTADACGGIAAVFSGSDESGYVFAIVTRQGELRDLCKEMTRALDGRGGGKGGFCQGSVKATGEQISEFFARAWNTASEE